MLEQGTRVRRILMLTLLVVMVVLLTLTSFASGSGKWQTSSAGCPSSGYTQPCTGSQVCADWDVDGEPLMTCCIEPEFLNTSILGACGQ